MKTAHLGVRALFQNVIAHTNDEPLGVEISHGKGIYLYGPEGQRYIDFISGIAVANVGHAEPEVVAAIREQSGQYLHTMVYGEHIQAPQVLLANRLLELAGDSFNKVYFTNSGAEAVEAALKIAKKFTGRSGMISCFDSYHGSSHGALSISGSSLLKEGYGPLLPEVSHIRFNDWEGLNSIDERTACVVLEPVQAEAGYILPEVGYLEAVRKRCDAAGTLLIFDEIQTGCGRSGSFFAFQKYGVAPDILLLAKGLGGGMPLGAVLARAEIMDVIKRNPVLGHITTFGGHPVCCAAGLASLNKIVRDGLPQDLEKKESLILERLRNHKGVKGLSGTGLMWAVSLSSFEQVLAVMYACQRRGLLIDWFLYNAHSLRIAPPLIITLPEMEEALTIVSESILEVMAEEQS